MRKGYFMTLVEQFSVKNDCYKYNVNKSDSRYTKFQIRGPLGIMIHSIGTPQPKAQVLADGWNQAGKDVAVHAVLEPEKVIQCLPWNFRGWHGASGNNGSVNDTHIGVEMTEPNTIKYTGGATWVELGDGKNTRTHVLGTYKTAVELFANICLFYGLDPLADGVIISHSEGYKRGIASNHGDVEHLWTKQGLSTAQFREDINTRILEMKGVLGTTQYEELKLIANAQEKLIASQSSRIELLNNQVKELMERNEAKYKTLEDIPAWGYEAVKDAVDRGILTGVSATNLGLAWEDIRNLTLAYRRENG